MSKPSLVILGTTRVPEYQGRIDKHLDGYYTLQYMSAGAVELAYDDNRALLDGEWFWPAYPGPHLVFHCAPGCDSWFHRHIGFSGGLVFEWIDAGLWPTEAQSAPPGKDYAALFDELIAHANRADPLGRRHAINLLEQILIDLAEARAAVPPGTLASPRTPEWLGRVIEKITSGSEIDYNAVAESEGMSASTLRRQFRAAMGISIHRYVIRRRVESARRLLVETELPLKAIADAMGYENQYYFSHQFREIAGAPPGLYRRAGR